MPPMKGPKRLWRLRQPHNEIGCFWCERGWVYDPDRNNISVHGHTHKHKYPPKWDKTKLPYQCTMCGAKKVQPKENKHFWEMP